MGKAIQISGTIERECTKCGLVRKCNVFEQNEKVRILCEKCTSNEFGTEDPENKEKIFTDREVCPRCKTLTMKQDTRETTINNLCIVKHYVCTRCHKTKTKKIRKWKKK